MSKGFKARSQATSVSDPLPSGSVRKPGPPQDWDRATNKSTGGREGERENAREGERGKDREYGLKGCIYIYSVYLSTHTLFPSLSLPSTLSLSLFPSLSLPSTLLERERVRECNLLNRQNKGFQLF